MFIDVMSYWCICRMGVHLKNWLAFLSWKLVACLLMHLIVHVIENAIRLFDTILR